MNNRSPAVTWRVKALACLSSLFCSAGSLLTNAISMCASANFGSSFVAFRQFSSALSVFRFSNLINGLLPVDFFKRLLPVDRLGGSTDSERQDQQNSDGTAHVLLFSGNRVLLPGA